MDIHDGFWTMLGYPPPGAGERMVEWWMNMLRLVVLIISPDCWWLLNRNRNKMIAANSWWLIDSCLIVDSLLIYTWLIVDWSLIFQSFSSTQNNVHSARAVQRLSLAGLVSMGAMFFLPHLGLHWINLNQWWDGDDPHHRSSQWHNGMVTKFMADDKWRSPEIGR